MNPCGRDVAFHFRFCSPISEPLVVLEFIIFPYLFETRGTNRQIRKLYHQL